MSVQQLGTAVLQSKHSCIGRYGYRDSAQSSELIDSLIDVKRRWFLESGSIGFIPDVPTDFLISILYDGGESEKFEGWSTPRRNMRD